MAAIEKCRTAGMGGRLSRCDCCGHEHPIYNSCGNRHCPKCQALARADWVDARFRELLPVPYFHNVFTLPHELNGLLLCNQRSLYRLLFLAAQETLLTFGRNPENGLGGQVGGFSMLHTWDQQLHYHVHLHVVIAGGALSNHGKIWIPSPKNFLFPIKPLSRVFRGKFLEGLARIHGETPLRWPDGKAGEDHSGELKSLVDRLYRKEWVVHSKAPFNGVKTTLRYLARYTHRIAISNHRILDLKNGQVTFSYRNRADENRKKQLTLPVTEFIHRFLLHVVPDRFMRVRHFGFLANRCRKEKLAQCRRLLGIHNDPPKPEKKPWVDRLKALTGSDPTRCPRCTKGKMVPVRELPPQRDLPFRPRETKSAGWDTS